MRIIVLLCLCCAQTIYAEDDPWARFARLSFGSSAFKERVFANQAFKENIEISLSNIQGVKKATITYNKGQESIFIREQQKGSATVMLTLMPGTILSTDLRKSVQAFVAHALYLQEDSIHVIDGDAYTTEKDEVSPWFADYQAQQEREEHYTKHVEQLVHTMYPKAKVVVSLMLHRKKTETQSVLYTPNTVQSAVRSVRWVQNKELSSLQRHFEISKVEKYEHNDPWEIQRKNIAVTIPQVLTQHEKRAVEELVQNAVGFNQLLGDSVHVADVAPSVMQTADKRPWMFKDIKMILLYILLFIITMVFLRQCKKWLLPPSPVKVTPVTTKAQPTRSVERMEEEVVSKRNIADKPKTVDIQDIQKLVRENPQLAAEIIKSWINE